MSGSGMFVDRSLGLSQSGPECCVRTVVLSTGTTEGAIEQAFDPPEEESISSLSSRLARATQ